MKISELLGEDDAMKIKAVSGNDVTIDQAGQEIKTTADALVPSADKPGEFTMKAPDPNQLKPGATVTQVAASENIDDEGEIGGDATDNFIDDVKVHEEGDSIETIPTTEFVKGVYDVAARYGADAPNPEEVKKLMVLAPNGEVDVQQTFNKLMAVFNQSLPKLQKVIADLEELIKQGEASGKIPAGTLANAQSQVQETRSADDALLAKMRLIAGLK